MRDVYAGVNWMTGTVEVLSIHGAADVHVMMRDKGFDRSDYEVWSWPATLEED